MAALLIILACVAVQFPTSEQAAQLTVQTSKGSVEGLALDPNPATGVSYRAFLGVPYGDQPKRFQLPVARTPWSGVLSAKQDGPSCPQPSFFPGRVTSKEDCLYLNVFTPLNATSATSLPVLVFIHGSAFTMGSSSSDMLGPDFLIPQDIILVTINYRLGAAGYLTLGTREAPGNLGLHDSRLALTWVRDEIRNFGGDPAQVTLAGESAGGIITHYNYMSTGSVGLFSKAISESGCAMMDSGRITVAEGVRRAHLLAEAVGCDPSLDPASLLACLQDADITSITGNQSIPLADTNVISGNDLRFVPVMDDFRISDKPFFTDTFDNLMKSAAERGVPLIMGFNLDEGFIRLSGQTWTLVEYNLGDFVPLDVMSGLSDEKKKYLGEKIRAEYFTSVNATKLKDKVKSLIRLYTDTSFAYPSVKMSRVYAKHTFGYLFAYYGSWQQSSVPGLPKPTVLAQYGITGVSHGDELKYIFYSVKDHQDLNTTTDNLPNLRMRDTMVQMWTSFIKTGVPASTWKTISSDGYLLINSTQHTINSAEFEKNYYNFWAGIESEATTSSAFGLNASFNIVTVISVVVALAFPLLSL